MRNRRFSIDALATVSRTLILLERQFDAGNLAIPEACHAGLRRRSAENIEKESLTTKLMAFLELAK